MTVTEIMLGMNFYGCCLTKNMILESDEGLAYINSTMLSDFEVLLLQDSIVCLTCFLFGVNVAYSTQEKVWVRADEDVASS